MATVYWYDLISAVETSYRWPALARGHALAKVNLAAGARSGCTKTETPGNLRQGGENGGKQTLKIKMVRWTLVSPFEEFSASSPNPQ